MTHAAPTRAQSTRCDDCGLPRERCFCDALPRLSNRTRVVVVLHHNELAKTTNTGRLAVRMLARAEVRVRGAHHAPLATVSPDLRAARRLLLFPAPGARLLSAHDLAPDLEPSRPTVLVVPDGSWSQARKIARRDPLAVDAEPVTFPPGPPSRYRLRRSPRADGLCTLEAIARALGVLEGAATESALLDALDTFVAHHRAISRRPLDFSY